MTTFKYHRGEYLRDVVTKFAGAVVGRADYLTSCNTYFLQPKIDKKGEYVEARWFDENRLEIDPAKVNEKRLRLPGVEFVDQPPG